MSTPPKTPRKTALPRIRADIVGRLSEEADLRTLPPEEVDWDEIHRQAAEARKTSS